MIRYLKKAQLRLYAQAVAVILIALGLAGLLNVTG